MQNQLLVTMKQLLLPSDRMMRDRRSSHSEYIGLAGTPNQCNDARTPTSCCQIEQPTGSFGPQSTFDLGEGTAWIVHAQGAWWLIVNIPEYIECSTLH